MVEVATSENSPKPNDKARKLAPVIGKVRESLTAAGTEAHDPTKEVVYVAKRSSLFMVGKSTAEATGETLREMAHNGQLLGISTSLGSTAAGLTTIGLAAGVSGLLCQMDYVHRKDNIKDMYIDELAVRLKKPKSQVTDKDLDTLAKENGVINEQMKQISKQRTYGMGISFLASMAALAVVTLALPAILPAIGVTGGLASLGWGGALAVKAITGLLTYNIVKGPLHHIADKVAHLDYTTTHDKITKLCKERENGKAITREQVLSIYVSANPVLDQMIEREYGGKFDSLPPQKKTQVASELNKILPLDKMALDINTRKVNVTELAFCVQGEISGIQHGRPEDEPEKGFFGSIIDGLKNAIGIKSHKPMETTYDRISALANAESTTTRSKADKNGTHSHVKSRGLEARNTDMTNVERLDQRGELPVVQQI